MDRFLRIVAQSLGAIWALKLRTFFCLISVALGIAAITVIVAAVEGAYKRAFEIVARFGPDSALIFGGEQQQRAIGVRQRTLTLSDVDAIRDFSSTAYLVVPMVSDRGVNVSYKNRRTQSQIVGSTEGYSSVWSWPVVEGSDLRAEDVKGLRNVGLIGKHLQRELFGEEDPVGKYIFVKSIPVRIIGVLIERGTAPSGDNLDDRLIMPISTVMRKLQNETKYVSAIRVRFLDQENLNARVEDLNELLRRRHRIPPGEPDDFRVVSPKEIIKFLVALTGSLVLFLGIVGLISLTVSGFVLANLFLLSVKERTREIGIRRAAGARKRDILAQFLSEAVFITNAGGIFGFALGFASSKLLVLVADFPIYFSWKAFAVGLVLSWAVGIGFGLQPARRAANLKPIEAVRG